MLYAGCTPWRVSTGVTVRSHTGQPENHVNVVTHLDFPTPTPAGTMPPGQPLHGAGQQPLELLDLEEL
jgi:hypothetical protein